MDRTKASDAFNAGSIPVGCIFFEKFDADMCFVDIVCESAGIS
jgi:hypothetical protein